MRDALSIFDRIVSFSGKALTRKAVSENLNVLDYDTFFETTELILKNKIPELLLLFNKTLALGFDGHHFINGLASHFRDLLVCQNQQTIELLEVSLHTKERYKEQANKTSQEFLIKGIDIANTCDLSYRTTKNQRLLVELTLMKLASITFNEEKKKPDDLAPAKYFRSNDYTKVASKSFSISEEIIEKPIIDQKEKLPIVTEQVIDCTPNVEINTVKKIDIIEDAPPPKIELRDVSKRISGVSISSLKAKKEHENSKRNSDLKEEHKPTDSFTEKEMQKHWADFVQKLDDKGKKILASNLNADIPKLTDENIICIELPNSTMKKEVEREQNLMLDYLKEQLNNYEISLNVNVNEESAKKFAFTPEEKYEKLKQKNATIDLLRKEFDLDI